MFTGDSNKSKAYVISELLSQINFLIFTREKKIYFKNNIFLYMKVFSSKLFIIIAIHL
jgi:hypothetical protein